MNAVPTSTVVDANPIINDPFVEPARYWHFGDVAPTVRVGRRIAGYLAPSTDGQLRITDELIPLETVNDLRGRVRSWREDGYPGATNVTRDLFRHWFDEDRKLTNTRPFFAQQEAVETVIFLVEALDDRKVGVTVPSAGEAYSRWATKMANRRPPLGGSGEHLGWTRPLAPRDLLRRIHSRPAANTTGIAGHGTNQRVELRKSPQERRP